MICLFAGQVMYWKPQALWSFWHCGFAKFPNQIGATCVYQNGRNCVIASVACCMFGRIIVNLLSMKIRFILLFCFTAGVLLRANSQLVFDKVKHDFEDVFATSERFVDIKITNKGTKKEYLLSVRKPMEVVYLVSGQFIEPDSSLIVRLQPNPKKTGKFSYDVEIYTSDRQVPTIVKLSGNIKEMEQSALSAMQACPDFNSRPSASATDFKLTVVTIDQETKKTLSSSTVSMLQNGKPLGTWKTNKNGQVVERVPLGYTYFYGAHEGYIPAEFGTYINFQRNYVVLELAQDPKYNLPVPVKDPVIARTSVPAKDTHSIVIEVPEPVIAETPAVVAPPESPSTLEVLLSQETPTAPADPAPVSVDFQQLPFENFDDKYFKPVNVVFVLDKSSSMLKDDKLELMKYSLYQLTDYLRPQDKMAIVTYSSTAKVLVPPTSAKNKDEILKPIEKIRPVGGTAGGDGIKLGFEQAVGGYITDGANLVIVITDGAFNKNSDDYQQYLEKHKSRGIQLSVVGIKNFPQDEQKMKEAAAAGNGRYVPIFKLSDAQQNLIQEIRISSFRK